MVDRSGAMYYILDGHNAKGISGGPVWHWSEERERFEVVAIISAYKPGDEGLPGFVIAEPIRQVTGFLRSKDKVPVDQIEGGVEIDCNLH